MERINWTRANFLEKARWIMNRTRTYPKGYPTDSEIKKLIDPKRLSEEELKLYNSIK